MSIKKKVAVRNTYIILYNSSLLVVPDPRTLERALAFATLKGPRSWGCVKAQSDLPGRKNRKTASYRLLGCEDVGHRVSISKNIKKPGKRKLFKKKLVKTLVKPC